MIFAYKFELWVLFLPFLSMPPNTKKKNTKKPLPSTDPGILTYLLQSPMTEEKVYILLISFLSVVIAARKASTWTQSLRGWVHRKRGGVKSTEVDVAETAEISSAEALKKLGVFKETDNHGEILDKFTAFLQTTLNAEATRAGEIFVFGDGGSLVLREEGEKEVMVKISELFKKYLVGEHKNRKNAINLIHQLLQRGVETMKGVNKLNTGQISTFHMQMGAVFYNIPRQMLSGLLVDHERKKDRITEILTSVYKKLGSLWAFEYVMFTGVFMYLMVTEGTILMTKEAFRDVLFNILTLGYINFGKEIDDKTKSEIKNVRTFWYFLSRVYATEGLSWGGQIEKITTKEWDTVEDNILNTYANRFTNSTSKILRNQDGIFLKKNVRSEYTNIARKLWARI